MENIIQVQYYQSPCGELILGSYQGRLCICDWNKVERQELIDRRVQKLLHANCEKGSSEVIAKTIIQLDEYFGKKRNNFDIPLFFLGTDFQKSVWKELLNIPYGMTLSYGDLSQRLGNPKAIRAVASANRANLISILVPCHRVIGSNRKLVGYSGGVPVKKKLLELESSDMLLY